MMTRFAISKIGSLICASLLVVGVLAGCASGISTAASEEAQANRAYMSQVNETMDQLSIKLESFVDAVSRGDVVNMRTQADDAYQTLDKLSAIEAPELFADIQKDYQDGTDKLREALDAYIDLYTEMQSASFDWSTYDDRMADIQSLYDEGVSTLQQADEKAAGLDDESASSASSSSSASASSSSSSSSASSSSEAA